MLPHFAIATARVYSETQKLDAPIHPFEELSNRIPIEALTHTAVLHHSEMHSDETTEALIDEAARLVTRYLQ